MLQRSTKVVGTIRANRKNFPKDFPRDTDIPNGAAVFKEKDGILALKYRGVKEKAVGKLKIVHLLSTKHAANMINTHRVDADGNAVQKPDAIIYYNQKMGGVDNVDQQLHGIQVMRKTYKWYHKIFFRLLMMSLLSAHKIYKKNGGRNDFLQFLHDAVAGLVDNAPHLRNRIRNQHGNLLRLTGRHFPTQVLYEGAAQKRKHKPKNCRVCRARGIFTTKGLPIRSTWQSEDCPDKPGLCQGECFKVYHTQIDYSK